MYLIACFDRLCIDEPGSSVLRVATVIGVLRSSLGNTNHSNQDAAIYLEPFQAEWW